MLVSDNKSMIISHETDQYEHCRLTHYFYFLVKKKKDTRGYPKYFQSICSLAKSLSH